MRRSVRFVGAGALGLAVVLSAVRQMAGDLDPRGLKVGALVALVAAIYALALIAPALRSAKDPQRWFDATQRHRARARAGGRCEYLRWGRRCPNRSQEIDHFIPHARGGATCLANAVCACRTHNQRKGARMPSLLNAAALAWRRRSYFPANDPRWPGEKYRVWRATSSEGETP